MGTRDELAELLAGREVQRVERWLADPRATHDLRQERALRELIQRLGALWKAAPSDLAVRAARVGAIFALVTVMGESRRQAALDWLRSARELAAGERSEPEEPFPDEVELELYQRMALLRDPYGEERRDARVDERTVALCAQLAERVHGGPATDDHYGEFRRSLGSYRFDDGGLSLRSLNRWLAQALEGETRPRHEVGLDLSLWLMTGVLWSANYHLHLPARATGPREITLHLDACGVWLAVDSAKREMELRESPAAIEAACPACGKRRRVKARHSGKRVACKGCEQRFVLPRPRVPAFPKGGYPAPACREPRFGEQVVCPCCQWSYSKHDFLDPLPARASLSPPPKLDSPYGAVALDPYAKRMTGRGIRAGFDSEHWQALELVGKLLDRSTGDLQRIWKRRLTILQGASPAQAEAAAGALRALGLSAHATRTKTKPRPKQLAESVAVLRRLGIDPGPLEAR